MISCMQSPLFPNSSATILLPHTSCCSGLRGSNTSWCSARGPWQGRISVAEEAWPTDNDAVCSLGASLLGAEGYGSPRPHMF